MGIATALAQASFLQSPPLVLPSIPVFMLQQESWIFKYSFRVETSLHKTFQLLLIAFRVKSNPFPWLWRLSGSATPGVLLLMPPLSSQGLWWLLLLHLPLLLPSPWSSSDPCSSFTAQLHFLQGALLSLGQRGYRWGAYSEGRLVIWCPCVGPGSFPGLLKLMVLSTKQ